MSILLRIGIVEGASIVPTRSDEQGGVVLRPDVVVGGVLGHVLVEATDVGEMGVCVVGGWAMWMDECGDGLMDEVKVILVITKQSKHERPKTKNTDIKRKGNKFKERKERIEK